MRAAVMAILLTAAIVGSTADAFAMAGSHGRKRGGSDSDTATYSTYQQGSWEYGSTPVAAPEPGTIVLLASGVAGLALWARRRK